MQNSKSMQKSKKIFFYLISILLLCLVIVLFMPSPTIFTKSNQTLNNEQSSTMPLTDTLFGDFDISIISRSGSNIILSDPQPYEDSQAYSTYWANAQSFSISFIADSDNPPPLNDQDPEHPNTYVFSLRVYYSQTYLEANNFENVQYVEYDNISISADYNTFATLEYQINIDSIFGEDAGWGIYRFVVDINSAEATSFYYAILPTTVVGEQPIITYDTHTSASGSLQSLYNFSLVNNDAFRYIDRRNLTWYVYGLTDDGVAYALTLEDLEDEYFQDLNCTQALWPSYSGQERTGLTFDLEINDLYGEWQVWCVYDYSDTVASVQSNIVDLDINAPFDYINVLYIILGICGFALLVTIGIIIYKIKKEKIW